MLISSKKTKEKLKRKGKRLSLASFFLKEMCREGGRERERVLGREEEKRAHKWCRGNVGATWNRE